MMFPHWKYAVGVFVMVFAIVLAVIGAFWLLGGKGLAIVVGVGGLVFMFLTMARDGP